MTDMTDLLLDYNHSKSKIILYREVRHGASWCVMCVIRGREKGVSRSATDLPARPTVRAERQRGGGNQAPSSPMT